MPRIAGAYRMPVKQQVSKKGYRLTIELVLWRVAEGSIERKPLKCHYSCKSIPIFFSEKVASRGLLTLDLEGKFDGANTFEIAKILGPTGDVELSELALTELMDSGVSPSMVTIGNKKVRFEAMASVDPDEQSNLLKFLAKNFEKVQLQFADYASAENISLKSVNRPPDWITCLDDGDETWLDLSYDLKKEGSVSFSWSISEGVFDVEFSYDA